MSGRILISVLCFGVTNLNATFASAGDDSAKKNFEEGIEALKKEDFSRALDAFEASYSITPKASVLYNIGMCQKAMFRYTDAKRTLEKFLLEKDRSAKDAHMVDTLTAIEEINTRIGKIEIASTEDKAAVHVDGRDVGQTPLSETLLVDPGTRMVEVTKDGFEPFIKEVKVASGEKITLEAKMTALKEPVAPSAEAPSAPDLAVSSVKAEPLCPKTDSKPTGERILLLAGISALNLAVAGAVAGGIFAVKWSDEYDKTDALTALCDKNWDRTCLDAHTYYSSKLASDKVGIIAGFAATGALIIAGTTLLIIHRQKTRKRQTAVGFGPMGISGTF